MAKRDRWWNKDPALSPEALGPSLEPTAEHEVNLPGPKNVNPIVKHKAALIVLILSLAAGALAGFAAATLHSERIAAGVTIAGVDVSGLTIGEARERTSPAIRAVREQPITLNLGFKTWRVTLRELGMSPNPQQTLAKASEIGGQGNLVQQFITRAFPGGVGKQISVCIDFDLEKLDAALNKIAREVQTPHKDATIRRVNGAFVIEPEKPGLKLDVGQCAKDIQAGVNPGQNTAIDLSLIEDKADVTAADLEGIDAQLATFSTRYPAWKVNRTFNIKLALKPLTGTVVKPGQVFSFNETVGPRLKKLGYRDAPIFVSGELEPGLGGGICQVSSTLYNAALLANMKIVRRSHHSSPVPYVPKGRDATVAYGLLDFKFRNTSSTPIYITAETAKSTLTVTIYGNSADKREVQILTALGKTLPHRTITVTSAAARPGSRVVDRAGHNGSTVTVYRVIKDNGVIVEREQVSYDIYRPLHTKIIVGPGAGPETVHTARG